MLSAKFGDFHGCSASGGSSNASSSSSGKLPLPIEDCHQNAALHTTISRIRVCVKKDSSQYKCVVRRKPPVVCDTCVGSRISESQGKPHMGSSQLSFFPSGRQAHVGIHTLLSCGIVDPMLPPPPDSLTFSYFPNHCSGPILPQPFEHQDSHTRSNA
jgi:hypothetical protein